MSQPDRAFIHKTAVVGRVAIAGLGSMATKQIQGQYLVDATFFEAAPLKRYQDTLPDDEQLSNKVVFVCLCPIPGTRSYECKVVSTRDTVKLSCKVLTVLEHSASHKKCTSKLQYLI
jgi:hypothetical protein